MVVKPSVAKAVIAAVAEKAVENAGEAMVYEMVSAARECITEAGTHPLPPPACLPAICLLAVCSSVHAS